MRCTRMQDDGGWWWWWWKEGRVPAALGLAMLLPTGARTNHSVSAQGRQEVDRCLLRVLLVVIILRGVPLRAVGLVRPACTAITPQSPTPHHTPHTPHTPINNRRDTTTQHQV